MFFQLSPDWLHLTMYFNYPQTGCI